jgi:hypothetical protein
MGDYATPAAINAKLAALLLAIPNPDVAPAQQGIRGYLDEMSPMCAAQLRVEVADLQTRSRVLTGSYTVTAGDVTATFAALPDPGFTPTVANCVISITRAGAAVGASNVPTLNGNNVRVATGGTYTLTAGDVIRYALLP